MKKPIQISIPTPCHENWGKMTPADKGRFCASCQKNVRDFTRSSDREIAEVLKTGGHACGRFRDSQLGRELYVPKEKNKFWAAASAAAITLLTVGVTEVSAQTPVQTEQHGSKTDDTGKSVPSGELKMITGTVLDEHGFVIPDAKVKIKGHNGQGVQTDLDGRYSINAKDGDVLVFEYIGMKTQTMTVIKTPASNVILEDELIYLGDVSFETVPEVSPEVEDKRLRISVASQYMFDR
ncbi:carboxypeptidase-like regulatory domain-containing protein [Flavobacterium sp. DGU11]|uniref:Carboxypeptidase-like regulatory domain-containing protein n=1 Tax=Flavobacterium arundinis TaxID=3139143 RepID=A0ABU9HT14_9FLAO